MKRSYRPTSWRERSGVLAVIDDDSCGNLLVCYTVDEGIFFAVGNSHFMMRI